MAIGMDVLIDHPERIGAARLNLVEVPQVFLQVLRVGHLRPALLPQRVGVIAQEPTQREVGLLDATIRTQEAHADGGVLHRAAETFIGSQDALRHLKSLGDVAPGEDDGSRCGSGGSEVVPAVGGADFAVVTEVIDDQWLASLQTPNVTGQKRLLARADLHHPASHQRRTRHPELVTCRPVDLAVAEIDDPARGIPHRFQEHTRVEQRVGAGPQHRQGRVLARQCSAVIAGRAPSVHPGILSPVTRSRLRKGDLRGRCHLRPQSPLARTVASQPPRLNETPGPLRHRIEG